MIDFVTIPTPPCNAAFVASAVARSVVSTRSIVNSVESIAMTSSEFMPMSSVIESIVTVFPAVITSPSNVWSNDCVCRMSRYSVPSEITKRSSRRGSAPASSKRTLSSNTTPLAASVVVVVGASVVVVVVVVVVDVVVVVGAPVVVVSATVVVASSTAGSSLAVDAEPPHAATTNAIATHSALEYRPPLITRFTTRNPSLPPKRQSLSVSRQ